MEVILMQITDVRVRKIFEEGPMKAIVSVTFDNELALHDVKVINAREKFFVVMPVTDYTIHAPHHTPVLIFLSFLHRKQRIIQDRHTIPHLGLAFTLAVFLNHFQYIHIIP